MAYHLSFLSGGCAFNVFLQFVLFFSLCGGCCLTATTVPSLRPASPKQFPYKVQFSPGSHHHPKVFFFFTFLLFPTVGHKPWSGRCSHISGSSYANAASTFFFRFGGGPIPAQGPVPNFPQPAGHPGCSLHKLQSVILPVELLWCPLDLKTQLPSCARVPYANFAFRALPAFLPGRSSLRSSRCNIVFGLSLKSECVPLARWVILLPAGANSFRGPQFPWVWIFLKMFLLRLATAARRDTFLQAAANFLREPQTPRVSSFGSPRRPAARCWPLCRFFIVPEDITTASSVGTSRCSTSDLRGRSLLSRHASVVTWHDIVSSGSSLMFVIQASIFSGLASVSSKSVLFSVSLGFFLDVRLTCLEWLSFLLGWLSFRRPSWLRGFSFILAMDPILSEPPTWHQNVTCMGVHVTKITGSNSHDWIYWHFGYMLS
jgi:hypothetical protein